MSGKNINIANGNKGHNNIRQLRNKDISFVLNPRLNYFCTVNALHI